MAIQGFKTAKKELIILVVFILLALAMTSPFLSIWEIHKSIHPGDARLNAWILAWDNYILFKNPADLFNSNTFYPNKATLAYSEHLFSVSLFTLPINLLFGNPILAHNIVWLLSFILSAFGMYLLCFYYTENRYASFFAGIIFAFNADRFWHISGHLQIISSQWIPFMVLYFLKFKDKPSNKNVLLFTLFFILQALTSWYLAVPTALILLVIALFLILVEREKFTKDLAKKLVLFPVLSFIFLAPFAYPYFKLNQEQSFERTLGELTQHSADLGGYLIPPYNSIEGSFVKKTTGIEKRYWEGTSYIGYVTIVASILALLGLRKRNLRRKKAGFDLRSRESILLYLILGFVGFILSLGPYFQWRDLVTSIKLPYYFVYEFLPPLRFMRAPGRLSLVVMFAVSLLAGFGLLKIINKLDKRWTKMVLLAAASTLVLLEYFVIIPYRAPQMTIPKVYTWLRQQPGDFAIAELPENDVNIAADADYMLYSAFHWKNLVNGYSGFQPNDYGELMSRISSFPSEDSYNAMKELKVKYVVIHLDAMQNKNIPDTSGRGFHLVKKSNNDLVYQIR